MKNAIYHSTQNTILLVIGAALIFTIAPMQSAKADCNYAGNSFTCGSDARDAEEEKEADFGKEKAVDSKEL